eukprot:9450_1
MKKLVFCLATILAVSNAAHVTQSGDLSVSAWAEKAGVSEQTYGAVSMLVQLFRKISVEPQEIAVNYEAKDVEGGIPTYEVYKGYELNFFVKGKSDGDTHFHLFELNNADAICKEIPVKTASHGRAHGKTKKIKASASFGKELNGQFTLDDDSQNVQKSVSRHARRTNRRNHFSKSRYHAKHHSAGKNSGGGWFSSLFASESNGRRTKVHKSHNRHLLSLNDHQVSSNHRQPTKSKQT